MTADDALRLSVVLSCARRRTTPLAGDGEPPLESRVLSRLEDVSWTVESRCVENNNKLSSTTNHRGAVERQLQKEVHT